jgi:hypothetical protein
MPVRPVAAIERLMTGPVIVGPPVAVLLDWPLAVPLHAAATVTVVSYGRDRMRGSSRRSGRKASWRASLAQAFALLRTLAFVILTRGHRTRVRGCRKRWRRELTRVTEVGALTDAEAGV